MLDNTEFRKRIVDIIEKFEAFLEKHDENSIAEFSNKLRIIIGDIDDDSAVNQEKFKDTILSLTKILNDLVKTNPFAEKPLALLNALISNVGWDKSATEGFKKLTFLEPKIKLRLQELLCALPLDYSDFLKSINKIIVEGKPLYYVKYLLKELTLIKRDLSLSDEIKDKIQYLVLVLNEIQSVILNNGIILEQKTTPQYPFWNEQAKNEQDAENSDETDIEPEKGPGSF